MGCLSAVGGNTERGAAGMADASSLLNRDLKG
jgi:hypothetical protein